MYVIRVGNVNSALRDGVALLLRSGEEQDSRAGKVVVYPTPVTTVYQHPQQRVLFASYRDANPVFHVMEALWMLAGRKDATFLDQFVHDFSARFAEADGDMHGAYGYRWRNHFDLDAGSEQPLDQLKMIIDLLRQNPDDRRVVLTMWDPVADLGRGLKDHPCNTHVYFRIVHDALDMTVCCRSNDLWWGLAGANACLDGGTEFASPEGVIALRELARQFKSGSITRYPVYSFDPISKDFHISWCVNAWRVDKKRRIELCFDDGTTLKLTSDHRLFHKKWNDSNFCEEIEAGDLRVGDRVWATQVWAHAEGRRHIKKNLGVDTRYSNMVKVARAYYEFRTRKPIPKGFDVHHKDENKGNDCFDNLEALWKPLHARHHILKAHPMQTEAARKKASLSRIAYFENMSEAEYEAYCAVRREHRPSEETSQKMSTAQKARWTRLSPEQKKAQIRRISTAPSSRFTGLEHSEETKQKQAEARRRWWQQRHAVEAQSNHKIIAINELDTDEVFDFTVEGDHNAMLSNGVFVHNCHFSILQEYIAAHLGCKIGTYYQISNNFHIYKNILDKVPPLNPHFVDPYKAAVDVTPIVTYPETFDNELKRFLNDDSLLDCKNTFLRDVARPLWTAYRLWRQKDHAGALATVRLLPNLCDWRIVTEEWMQRRLAKSMAKKAEVGQ